MHGTPRRPVAANAQSAGEPANDTSPFNQLLAGLFAPHGETDADDGAVLNAALPSSVNPSTDLGTLFKGPPAAQHTAVAGIFAGNGSRTAMHSSSRTLAARQVRSKEQNADSPVQPSGIALMPDRKLPAPQELLPPAERAVNLQPAAAPPAPTPAQEASPVTDIPAAAVNLQIPQSRPVAASRTRSGPAVKTQSKTPQPASFEQPKSQPAPFQVMHVQPAPSLPVVPPPIEVQAANSSAPERSEPAPSRVAVAQGQPLAGQPPRTVDSTPPAIPQPPASASTIEIQAPAADTQVRILAACTPDRGEVAFAVQLKPLPPSGDPSHRESPAKFSGFEEPRRTPAPATPIEPPAPEAAAEKRPSPAPEPEPLHAARQRRPEDAPPDRTEPSAGSPPGKVTPHTSDAQVKLEAPPERAAAEPAKTLRPQEATPRETAPEAAKGSPVRDMKLEVTGGDRRVEVRLSERGGEVRMTVRTPDAHLATALRENLPVLSSRLAENGYKNDAWHPAASSPGERDRTTEPSAGTAFQDANASPRQQDRQPHDHGGQRHHKNPEEPKLQQQKGRDFAWLMSSLR